MQGDKGDKGERGLTTTLNGDQFPTGIIEGPPGPPGPPGGRCTVCTEVTDLGEHSLSSAKIKKGNLKSLLKIPLRNMPLLIHFRGM